MPAVHLPATLKQRAGGVSPLDAPGSTAGEVLRNLERAVPALVGWILDERGDLRQHVHVFVNEEQADLAHPMGPRDEITVVQAISGGAPAAHRSGDPMSDARNAQTELLISTRKGLFVLHGERGGELSIAARRFEGQTVEYAVRDPRTGLYWAAVTNGFYGPHLYRSADPTAPTEAWEEVPLRFPEDSGAKLERIWIVQPGEADGELWAGVAPAALFHSTDGGATWELNRPLWDDPTHGKWEGGAGGLCLHSIAPWPGDPARLAIGTSAAGVWLTEDGGASWRQGVEGLVARYLPEELRATTFSWCVHNLHRSPVEPTTLYLQFHWGVYRSDDGGASWTAIGASLPSDFGFPLAIDPHDPGRAFVIPLKADGDRVTPDGRLRVYETRDRGASWTALTAGLPQEGTHLTILRQAFGQDGGNPLGLAFGAESGRSTPPRTAAPTGAAPPATSPRSTPSVSGRPRRGRAKR